MSELAIGLMSGTSLDGVDAALVRIGGADEVSLVAFHTAPYDVVERDAVLRATHDGSARDLALLHVTLGDRFASAAQAVIQQAGIHADDVSFVASHGQTVWHEPGRATLQLGDPAVIAEKVGVRVVSDFRSRDVAAGGQGAPLVPIADALLFGAADHPRALLNIGGMANVTWVPRRGAIDGVVAFDTGPGVAIIDAVMRMVDKTETFDKGGVRAARGKAVDDVVAAMLAHPYFGQTPPKSTGREMFGDEAARALIKSVRVQRPGASTDDCVATATRLTVDSIASQVVRWLPPDNGAELVMSGGGARNPVLVAGLALSLPGWTLRSFDDLFFDGDAKEAVAFAFLGWLTLNGRPGNVPAATGAAGPRVLGRITPP